MFDLWGFLLQTLTISGVAVLILALKAIFQDKLPPKWQFGVWSVLGIMMLLPAGIGGRYTLFHWQFIVEIIKSWCGDYGFTRVLFPFPVITAIPKSVTEWIFAFYVVGVIIHILTYVVSYKKLGRVIKLGNEVLDDKLAYIQSMAKEKKIRLGKVVEVSNLPSAFVYGIVCPILVLPTDAEMNEKIILHELFHLKNRDTLWSLVICMLRSLHWCNPLVIYCADRALNDLESRCDQYVLEHLEGEERRDYGHILLSMANEVFAKTPGSTCINNGGKKIGKRIENIARFKKYPKGMKLVSICVLVMLAFPLVTGAQSHTIHQFDDSVEMTLASARSTPCTTLAGAFDAYAKAILAENGYYRAMCAPESMQEDILEEMVEKDSKGVYPIWNSGIDKGLKKEKGFYVYNLNKINPKTYEALLVLELSDSFDGEAENMNYLYLAVQNLRVEKEAGRWTAMPLEEFRYVKAPYYSLDWGNSGLPGILYEGEAGNMRVKVTYQTIHTMESTVTNMQQWDFFSTSYYYDIVPKPNGEFTSAVKAHMSEALFLGNEEEKESIKQIGLSVAPVYSGEEPPENLSRPGSGHSAGTSNHGEQWISKPLSVGWDSTILLDGGGESTDPTKEVEHPEYYAADLYLNNEKIANLSLILQEGRGR